MRFDRDRCVDLVGSKSMAVCWSAEIKTVGDAYLLYVDRDDVDAARLRDPEDSMTEDAADLDPTESLRSAQEQSA